MGIRTAFPSISAYLPFLRSRCAKLGLRQPLSTIDGLPGSKRDLRTRVLPLTSVYRKTNFAPQASAFALEELSARQRALVAQVLTGADAPEQARFRTMKDGKRRRVSQNARETDQINLIVRPVFTVFMVRAIGGRRAAEYVAEDGSLLHAEDVKRLNAQGQVPAKAGAAAKEAQVQQRVFKPRSLYALGWAKFRQALLSPTDWDDLPAQEAAEVRKQGDPWTRRVFTEAGRRKGGAGLAEKYVAENVRALGEKEPWFRDRANFDELFPTSQS